MFDASSRNCEPCYSLFIRQENPVQLTEVFIHAKGVEGTSSESGIARDKVATKEILVRDMKHRVTINRMTHKGGMRSIRVGATVGYRGRKEPFVINWGSWGGER